ncbi:zinc ABC transporter substrate-binding protein [candidate division KSB1 bacterium]|nr:zinc ABC transporter substrate-binding protein [candidate division KSB1 bacterium]
MFKKIIVLLILCCTVALFAQRHQHRRHRHHVWGENKSGIKIVTSFSDYACITRFLVQDKGYVQYISSGLGDPHFVSPRPSYAMMLSDADMWVTTGLDLEVWSTTLLDKARNKKIMDGEIGFVAVSDGLELLEKVDKADRTEGDIHMMGNPHIQTGPLNWKQVARNIAIGLQKVDPANSEFYIAQRDSFLYQVDCALFGEALMDLFGGETLEKLLRNKTLFTFLQRDYQGAKLSEKLGGWLKTAMPLRGKKVVAYHKNWAYFADTFGLEIAGFVEPKPGIPPSAKHVQNTINLIKEQNIDLMLIATYFEKSTPQMIEARTGVKAVYLPISCGAVPGTENIFDLVDYWIDTILTAL